LQEAKGKTADIVKKLFNLFESIEKAAEIIYNNCDFGYIVQVCINHIYIGGN
jgi:hypothetical protein